MKFAKELEEDLVPEWRVKYFNYKLGKKKVKAVSRALKNVNRNTSRPSPATADSCNDLPYTHYDFDHRDEVAKKNSDKDATPSVIGSNRPRPAAARKESITMFAKSPPILNPSERQNPIDQIPPASPTTSEDERRPLQQTQETDFARYQRYGSIVGSPPDSDSPGHLPALELPDPALDPRKRKTPSMRYPSYRGPTVSKPAEPASDAYHVGPQNSPQPVRKLSNLPKHLLHKHHKPDSDTLKPSKLRRVFKTRPLDSPALPDVQLGAYQELDAKQDDFFSFLDKELDKIEKFYQAKEGEAEHRLNALRDQLHEMRDQRLQDMETVKRGGKVADKSFLDGQIAIMSSGHEHRLSHINGNKIIEAGKNLMSGTDRIGKTSQAMKQLGSPQDLAAKQAAEQPQDGNKDYIRKNKHHEQVPYRFAKRRLKLALQEFYRGLELLKSYALLNRTAFRKINKKYDKAVNARPTLQYMANKVNEAHFVKSSIVEDYLVAVEDLYARYFERGHHKIAVNKLRSRLRPGDHSMTTFRNGLYVAAGACFGIAGLVNAGPYLFSDNPVLKTQTSYLLQIYAGYFLALLLMIFFVLDCRIWHRARVNYVFVFEFDTRHVADWRQLAELPCFFLFLNGLLLWLNFEFHNAHPMFLYWPVILLGLTLLIIFMPLKILYYHSRIWFAYSNWRLLLAGLYPVEFRDFFFGDMYCSETYMLSQISLFFCLYAHNWNNPAQCNSNHSMLLGFFTTLPAIWRALQCLRRYYDTRNWFPHLANFAKYLCNILYYMTLSLYRLNINSERRAVFIVFASVNGVYCSLWDVLMDWSLGNPWARHPFLRDNLAYRHVSVYYLAIVADVVLRQQWVFYAIFTHDLQHSAVMSFVIGLAEVIRRGMWSLFRVENEHCNNVVRFRASRDVPLPYALPSAETPQERKKDKKDKHDGSSDETLTSPSPATATAPGSGIGTAVDLERNRANTFTSSPGSSMRQRKAPTPGMSALRRVGTVLAAAHSQDFQKKRRPEVGEIHADEATDKKKGDSSDDEDDDETDGGNSVVSDADENGQDLPRTNGHGPGPSTRQPSHQHHHTQHHNHSSRPNNASTSRSTDPPPSRPSRSVTIDTAANAVVSPSSSDDDARSPRNTGLSSPDPDIPIGVEGASDDDDDRLDTETPENRADLMEVRDRISRARSPGS